MTHQEISQLLRELVDRAGFPAVRAAIAEVEAERVERLLARAENTERSQRTSLLDVNDVARSIKETPQRVRQLARDGTIRAIKSPGGRRWLFEPQAVEDYIASLRRPELDSSVSHPYNPERDRIGAKARQRAARQDTEGVCLPTGRPLEHGRKVRKKRARNTRAPVPFSYPHLQDEKT